MTTKELITKYGIAHRDWYQNQHDQRKLDRANRLQKRCEREIRNTNNREELNAMFLNEHYSTLLIEPSI